LPDEYVSIRETDEYKQALARNESFIGHPVFCRVAKSFFADYRGKR